MRKEVVGLLGSIAVNVILAAAGVLVKGRGLLYAGIIGLALTAILWLWSWAFAPPKPETDADKEIRAQRRKIIADARWLAQDFTMQARQKSFRHYLEYRPEYPAVRARLSKAYLAKLEAPRTTYSKADGAKYEALVQWFLEDIDRLEREWRLS